MRHCAIAWIQAGKTYPTFWNAPNVHILTLPRLKLRFQTVWLVMATQSTHYRRPYQGPLLAPQHRSFWLEWRIASQNWRWRQRDIVFFSNETRVSVDRHHGRIIVYCRPRTSFDDQNVLGRDRWRRSSATTLGRIYGRHMVGPVFFQNLHTGRRGGITTANYFEQILQPRVPPFYARHRDIFSRIMPAFMLRILTIRWPSFDADLIQPNSCGII